MGLVINLVPDMTKKVNPIVPEAADLQQMLESLRSLQTDLEQELQHLDVDENDPNIALDSIGNA